MENASKALLIAASVLIVILLIAFGMKIFNSTTGTADSVEGSMQTTEMTMFNNKFMPYIGNNKTENDAISLVNLIIANNATNSGREIKIHYIIGEGNTDYAGANTNDWKLKRCLYRIGLNPSNKTYNITISDSTGGAVSGYTNGFISAICIKDN